MARSRVPLTPEERKARAYRWIFHRRSTYADVFRWLRRWRVPQCDRRDIMQDTLERAFRSWHTYDPQLGKPDRWLRAIARCAAIEHHRRFRSHDDFVACDTRKIADPNPSGQEVLGVLSDLQSFDVTMLSVVAGFDIGGLPMKVVAGSLGIALSTAYNRRARVIATLQAA